MSELINIEHLFNEIIKNITHFDEFEKIITSRNNKEKGDLFEYFAKMYFMLIPAPEYYNAKYYMYNEISKQTKEKLQLPDTDKGIDGILTDNNNANYAVQVKFRSKPGKKIPFGDMATFMALSYGTNIKGIKNGIFFTNCYEVCDELNNDKYIIIN